MRNPNLPPGRSRWLNGHHAHCAAMSPPKQLLPRCEKGCDARETGAANSRNQNKNCRKALGYSRDHNCHLPKATQKPPPENPGTTETCTIRGANAAPAQPLAGRSPRTLRRGVQPDAVFVVMRKILGRPRNHGGRLPKPEQKFLQSPGMAAGPQPASPKSKPKAAPENSRTSRNLHHEKPQCPAWAQPLAGRSPRTLRRDVHPRRNLCRDAPNLGAPAKP